MLLITIVLLKLFLYQGCKKCMVNHSEFKIGFYYKTNIFCLNYYNYHLCRLTIK